MRHPLLHQHQLQPTPPPPSSFRNNAFPLHQESLMKRHTALLAARVRGASYCHPLAFLTIVGAFAFYFAFSTTKSIDSGDGTGSSSYLSTFSSSSSSSSSSASSSPPPLPFPVHAFWHMANIGKTQVFNTIFQEQYDHLQTSGLLDTMHVSASYVDNMNGSSMPQIKDPRIHLEYMGGASLHEFPTLRKVQSYCTETPNGRVIYFHSKGVIYDFTDGQYNRSREWRLLMEHFMFDLHRPLLLKELSDASRYVTLGVQYRAHSEWDHPEIPPHYQGNFWMAKCSYINTLPRIDTFDLTKRYEAEFWIGRGEDFEENHRGCWKLKPEECNPSSINLYACQLQREAYINEMACREGDQIRG